MNRCRSAEALTLVLLPAEPPTFHSICLFYFYEYVLPSTIVCLSALPSYPFFPSVCAPPPSPQQFHHKQKTRYKYLSGISVWVVVVLAAHSELVAPNMGVLRPALWWALLLYCFWAALATLDSAGGITRATHGPLYMAREAFYARHFFRSTEKGTEPVVAEVTGFQISFRGLSRLFQQMFMMFGDLCPASWCSLVFSCIMGKDLGYFG